MTSRPEPPFFPRIVAEDDVVPAESWENRPVAAWGSDWGIGERLIILERVGSTNTLARRLAEEGAPNGTLIIAEEQTAGRGRAGKPWRAPKGRALLLSIILRPERPLQRNDSPGAIPLRVGLAAAVAIEAAAGLRVQVKWPNDLLVDGRKLAGILCEGSLTSAARGYLVAGIGINVAQREGDFDPSISQPATSIRIAAGDDCERAVLAHALYRAVVGLAPVLTEPLSDEELVRLTARDPLIGREVTVDGRPAGTAHGIAPDGTLRIIGANGTIDHLRNGTVRMVPGTQSR